MIKSNSSKKEILHSKLFRSFFLAGVLLPLGNLPLLAESVKLPLLAESVKCPTMHEVNCNPATNMCMATTHTKKHPEIDMAWNGPGTQPHTLPHARMGGQLAWCTYNQGQTHLVLQNYPFGACRVQGNGFECG